MSEENRPHDNAYKYLFKNKRIFHQLLHSFVYEDFVKEIRVDDLELVDKSFVSEEFIHRESDLIYKVKFRDKEYFIYILIEFQSKPDKSIPVRMFSYIMLLYDLIYKNSKRGKLPNVFPLILYNGKHNWNVPKNISGLIDKNIPERYIPQFEYYLISEKDVPDNVLLELSNLVAAVVYLEKQDDEKKLAAALEKIVDFIKKENIIDIRVFTRWLTGMFRIDKNEPQYKKIKDIQEAKSMLSEVADKLIKKWKEEGREEGREEGIKQGKIDDAKKMLEDGLDAEIIAKYTGLSIQEIEKL
jgi:predicted transposase/invertase (TIGR01784 family)